MRIQLGRFEPERVAEECRRVQRSSVLTYFNHSHVARLPAIGAVVQTVLTESNTLL